MKIQHISYSFVLYLALIEGLSLFVMDKGFHPFLIGFIPMLIVLSIYRIKEKYLPILVNNKKITDVPIIPLSIANGVFIVLLFFIQSFIPMISSVWYQALFGFASVMIAILIMIGFYNTAKRKISYVFALYAGVFEFFILPLMFVFYQLQWHVFVNGFVAGLMGSLIGLFITNKILKKKPILIY